jgi:hypothetical protein
VTLSALIEMWSALTCQRFGKAAEKKVLEAPLGAKYL